MIQHYLLLVYRNFKRAKSYFLINMIGLSTGLTCALLIFLWVRDEFKINQFHANDQRLFQVMEHQKYADEIMTTSSTPGILAETLKEEFPEVELSATTTWINSYTLSLGDRNVKANGYHVGKDFFQIFSLDLVEGNAAAALDDKFAMVISRGLAKKLFGTDTGILGKTVELQHEKTFTVTGLFEGTPTHSSLQFDFVMNFEEYKAENEWVLEWGNNGPSSYVVLREGADPKVFEAKIKDFIKTKQEDSHISLFLQRYSDRYLYGRYDNGKPAGGRIEYVRLFSIIAVFILVIACINFMNLSTARASRKAKEVGIKKSIGAQRGSLIFQYLSESLLISFLALVMALMIVWIFLPQFNTITGKKITLDLMSGELVLWLIAIVGLTGLLSGSYPALYLSGFRPAEVLKGEMKGSPGELWARKGLVVFQFFLSVILIVSVMVIYKQIQFVQGTSLGYQKDNLIQFPIEGKVRTNLKTFLDEVRRIPGVVDASSSGHSFLGRNNNTMGLHWEGKSAEDLILFENVGADFGLDKTMGLQLVAGRFFSEDSPSDTSKIVFNEAAIRVMGLKDPIGQKIRLWDRFDLEIVGVVKDFHFQSLHDVVNPLFFRLGNDNTWTVMVRLEGARVPETLDRLASFYKEFNPGFDFEYKFQDQEYARQYEAEQRVSTLSGYFASIAIVISCLGLFGLAAFTAERRLKEIGIRKALGSSSGNIVMLLSGEFTKMVSVSIIIGLPVSWYLLDQWLQKFAFHIDLEIWYFALAGMLSLVIAWATVASQAIRASRTNPVKCLRTE